MVSPRENVTHKCVRTQVGPISNSSVAKEPAPNNNQTEHVQLNSWLIHQPQGRNTLHGTCTTDTGTLVLVHAERYVSHGVACPRQNKHSGGQRIEGVQDQDRLEMRPPSNPTISVRMKDRSFCHQVDSSIEAIHQLQTRSRSPQLRCSECELEQVGGICLPPFQEGTSSLEQGVDRPDR